MSIERELYALLGVDQKATAAAIKAAYRRLVKTAHPDAGGDPEVFVRICQAYEVLSDSKSREEYDLAGHIDEGETLQFQESVLRTMADAFDQVLTVVLHETGGSIEMVAFMDTFRGMIENGLRNWERQDADAKRKLKALHRLHMKIRRAGEEKNLFKAIIERQVEEQSAAMKDIAKNLKIARRVWDESQFYDDVPEFIRAMQAGLYPAPGKRDGAAPADRMLIPG